MGLLLNCGIHNVLVDCSNGVKKLSSVGLIVPGSAILFVDFSRNGRTKVVSRVMIVAVVVGVIIVVELVVTVSVAGIEVVVSSVLAVVVVVMYFVPVVAMAVSVILLKDVSCI